MYGYPVSTSLLLTYRVLFVANLRHTSLSAWSAVFLACLARPPNTPPSYRSAHQSSRVCSSHSSLECHIPWNDVTPPHAHTCLVSPRNVTNPFPNAPKSPSWNGMVSDPLRFIPGWNDMISITSSLAPWVSPFPLSVEWSFVYTFAQRRELVNTARAHSRMCTFTHAQSLAMVA